MLTDEATNDKYTIVLHDEALAEMLQEVDDVLTSSSDENESSEDDYNDSLSQDCDDESDLGDNDGDGLGAQLETALQAGGDWGDGSLL